MTCAEVRDNLAEHAMGLLGSEDRREVDRHLQWCAGCRKESADLLDGMATVASSLPPAEPMPMLEDRVVTHVRAAAGKVRVRRSRRGIKMLASATLAAAVLATSAVGWGVRQQGQAARAKQQAQRVEARTADTTRLIKQFQSQLNGSGKLYEASLYPLSRKELGGSSLMYREQNGNGWVVVDIVASLDKKAGPFTVNMVSTTGQRLAVGSLTLTEDGDYVLFDLTLPHDFTRPDAVELSHVMTLEVIDRFGARLLSGTVHRFVNTQPSP